MALTKEQFRTLWDGDETGGGITYDDIADCAKAWGLFSSPKTQPIHKVKDAVVKAAKCLTK